MKPALESSTYRQIDAKGGRHQVSCRSHPRVHRGGSVIGGSGYFVSFFFTSLMLEKTMPSARSLV
jgi:hypothetical protein